jgi:release factor glutamine methyltransferase
MIDRRLEREPFAYISGRAQFFGLEMTVSRSVLIPRPETELLVEKAIAVAEAADVPAPLIADIGTGCGAIAIALAVKMPRARLYATDISRSALDVAELNCREHGVQDRVGLLEGDLAKPLPGPVHMIVANLPYVTDDELPGLAPEVSAFEPRLALAGGPDGLRLIERLMSQAHERLLFGGVLLLEIGHDQAEPVRKLAASYFPEATVGVQRDLSGLHRIAAVLPRG